ncbi:hypothetical protein D3C76_1512460 [compost metagenome]
MRGAVAPLVEHLIGQRLFLWRAGWCAAAEVAGDIARQPLGIVGVELPQVGQLRAEGHLGVAGAPGLLAIPVLDRALYIKTVVGVQVQVPAQ